MGFECGFDKIKKYKDFSLEKILEIKHYVDWKSNGWNFKIREDGKAPYDNYKYYWNIFYRLNDNETYPGEPNEKDVNDYFSFIGGKKIEENIDFWCSNGREYLDTSLCFFDSIKSIKEDILYIVDKSFIEEARKWLKEQFNDCDLSEAKLVRGFKYIDDKNIEFIDIDGIQIAEEIDEYSRIIMDKNSTLLVPSVRFNQDQYDTLKGFETFLNELDKIDFNEYYIVYYRSY